jgi:hypothetical protein
MKPLEQDAAYLWDMLDAAKLAAEMSAGTSLDQLLNDVRTRYAVERALEIVGEAARRVSQETRQTLRRSLGQALSDSETLSPISTGILTTADSIRFSKTAFQTLSSP